MFKKLLLFLCALTFFIPTQALAQIQIEPTPPTVNLSAIIQIKCNEWRGTGFIIAKNTVVTALHVASHPNCKVATTGAKLHTYHSDSANDFALMTGNVDTAYYIKYKCSGYTPGRAYFARGFRDVFREDRLIATSEITDNTFLIGAQKTPFPGMRHLKGTIRAGMSGSPITDEFGYAVGIANVSMFNVFGIEVPHSYSYELKNTVLCK